MCVWITGKASHRLLSWGGDHLRHRFHNLLCADFSSSGDVDCPRVRGYSDGMGLRLLKAHM